MTMLTFFVAIAIYLWYNYWPESYEKQLKQQGLLDREYITFFHPFCDSGGGGERVLWKAIDALITQYPNKNILIYCWSGCKTSDVLENVRKHFGLDIPVGRIGFIKLKSWKLLEAHRYPFLTLLVSSLGSMIVGWEAVLLFKPKLVIESVGFAFVYPIFKLFGAKVVSYVHYPTISTDMIQVIEKRTIAFNNSQMVAKSSVLSRFKLYYYILFAKLYGLVGRLSDVVMVNSTWTSDHIRNIWNVPSRTRIVYPPCDTTNLVKSSLENRNRVILSVAQFRPEKNHTFQIEIMKALVNAYPEYKSGSKQVKLVFIGSVRNVQDEERVANIRELIHQAGLNDIVHIVENASYQELLGYLSSSLIGLHVMTNEHFGISIIEYMASGLIPLAHDSGGPKMDIVTPECGFLSSSLEEYVESLHKILCMDSSELLHMQKAGRQRAQQKFSEKVFNETFLESIKSAI